jgi:RNA polymerase sigma-70 factor (ECF subfamily)
MQPDGEDDAAAIAAFKAGNPAGFHALFRKHRGRVYAQAWRMLRDEGLAMDVVQETFLALLGVLPAWEPRARLSTWLGETAWRLARTQRRRRLPPGVPEDLAAPEPKPADEEEASALWEAVASLPAREKQAVLLRYAQGLPIKQVATEMGITPGAVGAHLARALAQLRDKKHRLA